MNPFKELREQSGMTRNQFCEYFGIPYRTVQDWELGNRKCPEYLIDLMKYKLDHEQKAYEEKMRISKLLAEASNMMTREEVEKIFFGNADPNA